MQKYASPLSSPASLLSFSFTSAIKSPLGMRRCIRSPGGLVGKESAGNVGDLGMRPGLGRFPGGGHGNPLQYSCLENPMGREAWWGYSPWGLKESDTTERLAHNRGTYTHQQLTQGLIEKTHRNGLLVSTVASPESSLNTTTRVMGQIQPDLCFCK